MNKRFDMRKSVKVQVDSGFALLLPSGVYEIKKMQPRCRLKYIVLICGTLAIAGIIGFGYFCPDQVCALTKRGASSTSDLSSTNAFQSGFEKLLKSPNPSVSYEDMQTDHFKFDMDAHDVMVFLHIQKTGGTSFGKHLVEDLDLKRPCECLQKRKRCYCLRPNSNENWLFSRYSTGWKCGLHADWTELTSSCVRNELNKNEGKVIERRYFYITVLREPIVRYLSEFRHVQRGATWKTSRHVCMGRQPTANELPPCYSGDSWMGVNLEDFTKCDSNLATNRQTRMLSDLALIGCYNKSTMPAHERDRLMLASAKRNLATMSYFGLTEYQKISQYVFETTFNLRFALPFSQQNSTVSSSTLVQLTPEQKRKVSKLNALDVELYEFAKNLLFERFAQLKAKDSNFEDHFNHLGVLRTGVTEFNWDRNIDESN